jgi:hypothetical protein
MPAVDGGVAGAGADFEALEVAAPVEGVEARCVSSPVEYVRANL